CVMSWLPDAGWCATGGIRHRMRCSRDTVPRFRVSPRHDAGVTMLDLLIRDVHLATMAPGGERYGALRDAALGVCDGRIAWLGSMHDVPRDTKAARTLDGRGRWLTPGLIDCHTHLVYAGNRAAEFEARLKGATYADIAKAG